MWEAVKPTRSSISPLAIMVCHVYWAGFLAVLAAVSPRRPISAYAPMSGGQVQSGQGRASTFPIHAAAFAQMGPAQIMAATHDPLLLAALWALVILCRVRVDLVAALAAIL